MNKIERLKNEKDSLLIKNDLERFAREGWESISEDDLHRLKWYGLFLRKPTPGYFMLRVRIPNGLTYSHQVKVLADIADTYGNGVIDITTRQQIQLRHLRIETVLPVFEMMEMVGLTSLQTGMDNVRNIMGCPVAGLQSTEVLNGFPIVAALNQHILENREFTNLPRKFNLAVSGCPHNCIEAETQDLALVPARKVVDENEIAGFNIIAGGKLGSGGYRIATHLDIFVQSEEAVEVCGAIISLYRDYGDRETRTANRFAFLVEEWGEARVRAETVKRLKRPLMTAGEDAREAGRNDHVGIYRQKQPGMNYVGLKVVTGRISGKNFRQAGELAERYGNGDVRLTPSQNIVLPHVTDKKLGDLLEEPLLKELLYAPFGMTRHLVSCVGSDYCSMATIETKSRAVQVSRELEKKLDDPTALSIHWSGCPAGCGNHLVADIGLLGKKARVKGKVVDAVDIFVGGRTGPNPALATRIMENVPCDDLADVLKHVVPYHTREKMHPVRRKRRARSVRLPEEEESTGSPVQLATSNR